MTPVFASTSQVASGLRALATDATRQLDVLGHDGDALGMDGAQVGVLKQADQVGLGRLLQREDGAGLEAQVGLEVLRNLANQALERQLADEQLRALLVLADLAARGNITARETAASGQRGSCKRARRRREARRIVEQTAALGATRAARACRGAQARAERRKANA